MELSSWQCFVLIIYTLVISCVGKPFSLNEAIAAETRTNQDQRTSTAELPETSQELYTKHKDFRNEEESPKPKKFIVPGLAESIFALRKHKPLKYKKAFEIKYPFKTNLKSKLSLLRKNQAVKRHTYDEDEYDHKYVPLLKNLGFLVDRLLTADTRYTYESVTNKPRKKVKRNRHTNEKQQSVCSCPSKSDLEIRESRQTKKTTATSTAKIAVTTETATETTDYTTSSYLGYIRQDKNDAVLPSRNTTSRRRNNHRHDERSDAPFHRSDQRYNAGDNGDSKHYSRNRRIEASSEDNEEYTTDDTRDRPSNGVGGIRGFTHYPRNTVGGTETEKDLQFEKIETDEYVRSELEPLKRKNKLEMDGDETKVATVLPEHVRGARTPVPESTISVFTNPIPSKEDNEDSVVNITSNKRLADRNGAISTENKKVGESNEAIVIHNLPEQHQYLKNSKNSKPIVMIIDGYSIARDKNGKNKYAEKKIRIRP